MWPTEYDEKPDQVKAIAKDYGNVDLLMQPAAKLTAPQPVDVVFTSQNYHDYPDKFMGPTDLMVLNAAVFAALKPGGVYIIVDQSAEAGSGMRDTDTLHRIDPAYRQAAGDRGRASSTMARATCCAIPPTTARPRCSIPRSAATPTSSSTSSASR